MKCENCGAEIQSKWGKRFCSLSCAGSFNGRGRLKSNEERQKVSQSLKEFFEKHPKKIQRGFKHAKAVGKGTTGKYNKNPQTVLDLSSRTISKIMKRLGVGCCVCGWDKSSCDIHHINGRKIENANAHNNLTYLCPNCHRCTHNKLIDKSKLIPMSVQIGDRWKEVYFG